MEEWLPLNRGSSDGCRRVGRRGNVAEGRMLMKEREEWQLSQSCLAMEGRVSNFDPTSRD
jgi:hypothetical protein